MQNDEFYYPEITQDTQQTLALLKAQINNPAYLDSEDCPYPQSIVTLLKAFMLRDESNGNTTDTLSDIELEDINIEDEARQLYKEMRAFKNALDIEDVSEKAQMFRVSTSLLEKLLDIAERAAGIKDFNRFQQVIMDTMDRYLEPHEKSDFVDRMNEVREG